MKTADALDIARAKTWLGRHRVELRLGLRITIAGALALWRAPRQEVRGGVRRFSIDVTIALVIATLYLGYWGIIALRTWD